MADVVSQSRLREGAIKRKKTRDIALGLTDGQFDE
jgi:hypothetical protein